MLGRWLEPLPDGTYPNINLAREILLTINQLQIDSDNLDRSKNLAYIVKQYSKGCTGNQSIQLLAKSIMDKWSRILFNINTTYDNVGPDEDQYRRLKNKLARIETNEAVKPSLKSQ